MILSVFAILMIHRGNRIIFFSHLRTLVSHFLQVVVIDNAGTGIMFGECDVNDRLVLGFACMHLSHAITTAALVSCSASHITSFLLSDAQENFSNQNSKTVKCPNKKIPETKKMNPRKESKEGVLLRQLRESLRRHRWLKNLFACQSLLYQSIHVNMFQLWYDDSESSFLPAKKQTRVNNLISCEGNRR